MKTVIDWKPSELPDNVIIQAYRKDYVDEYGPEPSLYSSDAGGWMEVNKRGADYIERAFADETLKILEIISVPKSWYEEFRPVEGTKTSVNREGWVIRTEKTFIEKDIGLIFDRYKDHYFRIEDAVRKDFSG